MTVNFPILHIAALDVVKYHRSKYFVDYISIILSRSKMKMQAIWLTKRLAQRRDYVLSEIQKKVWLNEDSDVLCMCYYIRYY